MRYCPVTRSTDHRVTWRCYAVGVCYWLVAALPYQLARPFIWLIGAIDPPPSNQQNP